MDSMSPHVLHGKFQRIMALARRLESKPRGFGTGERLSSSEIHLVEVIGENEGLGVTDLARALDVTKGAISQNLKRLESKGLVVKRTDPDNRARVLVGLSDKGRTAFYAHRWWHARFDGGFREFYLGLPPDQVAFLAAFLDRIEVFFREMMEAE
jgi:DNA-binding MarR family transcriptional regulator